MPATAAKFRTAAGISARAVSYRTGKQAAPPAVDPPAALGIVAGREMSPPGAAVEAVFVAQTGLTRNMPGTDQMSKYSSNSCGCGRSRTGSSSLVRL
jgi:hypothetical protein